jgi:hypothetical protein
MNKQEALAYIESGAEATKANNDAEVRHGWAVRLLGYGYRPPSKLSTFYRWKTREEWDVLRTDGAKGVLVHNIRYNHFEVVPLRMLFPTTVEQAKADYEAWKKRSRRERREREAKYERDKADAAVLTEQLGGSVNERYGTTTIVLTIDQARELVEELAHLRASRNIVVGSTL